MDRKVMIAVLAVLVIGIGLFALTRSNTTKNSNTTTPTQTTPTPSTSTSTNTSTQTPPPAASTDQTAGSTITYGDSGFSPSPLTVKAGTTVTIKNASSRTLQFDSNPHPQHTDDPELNIGVIASGQSKTFTANMTGSHGYHNHLNASDTGTLVVK